jgi:NAD(P)-dependent dehydrogenase (short-subunit alcohol dehydrogenase family)
MSPSQGGIVILGGGGAMGAETARLLTEAGQKVLLAGRSEAPLKAASAGAGHCPYEVVDATQSAEVDACVQSAVKRFGGLSGAINFVGSFALKPLHLCTDDDFNHDWATNVHSALYLTRAAVGAMMKGQHGGSIVLLSSVAARHGMPNHESIATAKGGVLGLTLSAAATYAADNIRINAIAPGLVETKLTQSITNNAAMAQASANMHPLRRLGSPGDVARMAQFLLNPANDFITGQVFGVDGGLATLRPKR